MRDYNSGDPREHPMTHFRVIAASAAGEAFLLEDPASCAADVLGKRHIIHHNLTFLPPFLLRCLWEVPIIISFFVYFIP